MPAPAPEKAHYMFTDDIKFFQKVALFHPEDTNRFLTIKRAGFHKMRPNLWDLPGGNVGFGENHAESLAREVQEETELRFKELSPVTVVSNFQESIYYLFIGYRATALSTDVRLSNEHTEFRWVTKEEFNELESAGFILDLVKDMK